MRVINVITNKDNILDEIKSFGIVDEQLSNDVVQEAEDYFNNKIREVATHMTPEELDDNMEIYLEDAYYSHENDGAFSENVYICIVWSDIENIQI